jgi:hypothetical protein
VICRESLNPKVQGSTPCASTICVSGVVPARQDVPFDADRCHQLSVSRTAERTSFTHENASQRVKLPDAPTGRTFCASQASSPSLVASSASQCPAGGSQALSRAHFERVQPHSFENQRLQRSLLDSVTVVKVDGAN